MNAAIELLKLEIAKCESIREVLQEGHPRIMRIHDRINELRESIHKLQENDKDLARRALDSE